MEFLKSDLINILGKKDAEWYDAGCRIPLNAAFSEWVRLYSVKKKIDESLKSGKIKQIKRESTYVAPNLYVISDSISGVLNPADGKRYDSKSAYYAAVKAKGYEILGNDAPKQAKPTQKPIDWQKAVAEAINSTPAKRKKKR